MSNGLVKLALSTSGAKLTHSKDNIVVFIYQPQNTDTSPGISTNETSCI